MQLSYPVKDARPGTFVDCQAINIAIEHYLLGDPTDFVPLHAFLRAPPVPSQGQSEVTEA